MLARTRHDGDHRRVDGRPWPWTARRCRRPFAAYAPDTISVGSLSKTYWGGLRIGWLRVPEPRVDAFFRARLSLDLGVPLLEQLVATELVNCRG